MPCVLEIASTLPGGATVACRQARDMGACAMRVGFDLLNDCALHNDIAASCCVWRMLLARLVRLVCCRSMIQHELGLEQAASKFVPTIACQFQASLAVLTCSTQCSKTPPRYTRAHEAQVCASCASPCTRFARYLKPKVRLRRNRNTTHMFAVGF